jgi:hypothetical protein
LVVRRRYAAGVLLFMKGIVPIGLGLPGGIQNVTALNAGISVTIVGAVLAIFGYSEKTS